MDSIRVNRPLKHLIKNGELLCSSSPFFASDLGYFTTFRAEEGRV